MTSRFRNAWRNTLGLLLVGQSASATAGELADPSPIIEAFNQVCRSGLNRVQALNSVAQASGWSPKAARIVSTATGMRLEGSARPNFFHKGELTLVLASIGDSGDQYVCSISGRVAKGVSTRTLAAAMLPELQAGSPTIVNDTAGSTAQWRLAPDLQIEAGVRKNSSQSIAKLSARKELQHLARRD